MTQKILFVCLGNICRSPAAEGVFRHVAPEFHTDSAGTASWHEGKPPYGAMQQALQGRGLDVSDLRARQFSRADFDMFDLIIVMEQENRADVESLRPASSQTPVQVFTDYVSEADTDHVPDPYYTRDFEGCLDLIERASAGLKEALEV